VSGPRPAGGPGPFFGVGRADLLTNLLTKSPGQGDLPGTTDDYPGAGTASHGDFCDGKRPHVTAGERLKVLWWTHRVGSNPTPGTTSDPRAARASTHVLNDVPPQSERLVCELAGP
jgi:hypothetical protein